MGGIYLEKQVQKLRLLVLSYCEFFAQIALFSPHDYTCLFRRVGGYDGAFGF